mgnify:FL=1
MESSKSLLSFRRRRFILQEFCFRREGGGERKNLLTALFPWRCVREERRVASVFLSRRWDRRAD